VALWELGRVLSVVQKRQSKNRTWGRWLKENDISESTANQAIRLYEHDKSGKKIDTYDTITEAKIAAGIVQGRTWKKPQPLTKVDTGFGEIDLVELRAEHRRLFESIGTATSRLEASVGEIEEESDKVVIVKVIDLEIERLTTLRKSLAG
jgi:hypothetical protein